MIKVFYFIIPILMINGCKTSTATSTTKSERQMTQLENDSNCPEDGTCTVVVHQNSNLRIEEDETGSIYPQIRKGENMVVEYYFIRKGPPGTADGNYSESIHFEIPSDTKNLRKENNSLSDVKVLFGKHCFCPGEAGYHQIKEGKLSLTKDQNSITFDLAFSQNKTSQEISRIKETVSLK